MMTDKPHLYIRLEKPNNEYENGKLIFESSLNMTVNFRFFTCNHDFAEFKDKIYLEVKVDVSEAKKWLVDKLSLRTLGINDKVVAEFNEKFAQITGCEVDNFVNLDPVEAWIALNKPVKEPLPYGNIWTDKQYFPTPLSEREGFKCDHYDNKCVFKETPGWNDPIFDIYIDEYGRPIFRFRPDSEGWPATMECLLTDLETFLFENHNSTGEWLINEIFPNSKK